MTDDDRAAHLALALVPDLGPRRTRQLLERFGSPRAALGATAAQLEAIPGFGGKLAPKVAAALRGIDTARELRLLAEHRVRYCLKGDGDYPARLASVIDAPELLYLRGALGPADDHAVAIVGSRGCTSYGRRVAETMAAELCAAGYTVVSGLARGIDAAAHSGALQSGGRTIAVLAGGLANIYPPEHRYLAEEIAQTGAVLTETPMSLPPQPGMFPARNRIISGLSLAVVVIEANEKSGSLITATHAAEQGREVFAVPGQADSAASAGCLNLLRNGARLVRNAADVLEDLQGLRAATTLPATLAEQRQRKQVVPPPEAGRPANSASAPTTPVVAPPSPPATVAKPQLAGLEAQIYEQLREPRHLDELSRSLGASVGQLSGVLLVLEMRKVVRKRPGNVFERAE